MASFGGKRWRLRRGPCWSCGELPRGKEAPISLLPSILLAMFLDISSYLLSSSIFLSGVHAWGPLGHSTVASVALNFLKPETLHRTREILKSDASSNATLVSVANWADSYRKEPEGKFSYNFHFVDAEDDPLKGFCHIDWPKACPTSHGCIVTAM